MTLHHLENHGGAQWCNGACNTCTTTPLPERKGVEWCAVVRT